MKILILTDTHLMLKDSKNRKNAMLEGKITLTKIVEEVIPEVKPDIIIHMGDLFDRGYKTIPTTEYAGMIDVLKRMKDAVNGNLFLLLGNHEYTYSKDNPAFIMTTIVEEGCRDRYIKKSTPVQNMDIFTAPGYLEFDDLIINFLHFDPDKKYKIQPRTDKINIGLYHDDLVTFESQEELYHHRLGKGIKVTDTDIFDGVDVAILGHIHKPLVDFKMNNLSETTVIVPGALTNRTRAEEHTKVALPIITIENKEVQIEKYEFQLLPKEEIFITEELEKSAEQYQMAKMMKRTKHSVRLVKDFDDMLAGIEDAELEIILRKAHLNEPTQGTLKAREFITKELVGNRT